MHVSVPKTLEDWVVLGTSHRPIESRRSFEISEGVKRVSVTELKTRCCAIAPYQTEVDWYFVVEGQMFCGGLGYWKNEPKADRFVEVLRRLVLSVSVDKLVPK